MGLLGVGPERGHAMKIHAALYGGSRSYFASLDCADHRHLSSQCGSRYDGQMAFADEASETWSTEFFRWLACRASEASWDPQAAAGCSAACASDYDWGEE